jgi:D-arabinose 1-dehydrogenase-like Zn-dependent alcohol dehydrogenase
MVMLQAFQFTAPSRPLVPVARDLPAPGPGSVRVRIQACGICHGDALAVTGHFPGIAYPVIPGHEIAGVVDAVGSPLPPGANWRVGDRVGIGWNGGYCGQCASCRRGDALACLTETRVTGLTQDGGYASHVIARVSALASIPDALTPEEAAPLMCAGLTTFNALRHSGARPGDLVAIHGLGGLGHLGVQFAAKMGFRAVAIARGDDKGELAHQLGAAHYIDARSQDPAAELQRLGGARVVLSTVTDTAAMQSVLGGLGYNGEFVIAGAVPNLTVPALQLLGRRQSVRGWASGTAADAEDTLSFAALTGVRSSNEIFPLSEAPAAFARMMSGQARFRVVLRNGD